jgi:regulator of replication initiation timing
MHQTGGSSDDGKPDSGARELVEARASCWRMSHTIHSLHDTIAVLRAGANSLAIDNAILRLDNDRLRHRAGRPLTMRGDPSA